MNDDGSPARRGGVRKPPIAGLALLAGFAAALAWRITQGADFTDESYYANFIYDWLKGGIRSSTLMTLHETAAVVVYPAAKVYAAMVGGDTGLFLFLRALFVAGNVAAGLCWLAFLRRAGFKALGWFVAAAAIAFIPFDLPAPSYNTLGLQGMEIGLTAYGAAQIASGRAAWAWKSLSATGWAVATIAYPTLGAVLIVFLAATLVAGPRIGRTSYAAAVVGAQALGWALVLAAFGWSQLHASYALLAAGSTVTDWPRKIGFTFGILQQNPTFASECILSAAVGLFGRRIGNLALSLAMIAMVLTTLLLPPALFSVSHSLVVLLALSGLHLLWGFRPSASSWERLLAILYLAAGAAAFVTTATAYNSLYNFAVGGGAAALLSLVGPRSDWRRGETVMAIRASVAAGAFLLLALTHFYGDRPDDPRPRQKIHTGVFAGLWLQPDHAAALKLVREQIAPLMRRPGATVAEVGAAPGLILETGARPLMLVVTPVTPTTPAPVRAFVAQFHQSRPADWVMIFRSANFDPYNPFGDTFSRRYRLVRHDMIPSGSIELFQRIAGTEPGRPSPSD